MEEHGSRGHKTIHNSDWSIDIFSQSFVIGNSKDSKFFSYDEPTKNVHILEEFLKYFRDCLKEQGINIKD